MELPDSWRVPGCDTAVSRHVGRRRSSMMPSWIAAPPQMWQVLPCAHARASTVTCLLCPPTLQHHCPALQHDSSASSRLNWDASTSASCDSWVHVTSYRVLAQHHTGHAVNLQTPGSRRNGDEHAQHAECIHVLCMSSASGELHTSICSCFGAYCSRGSRSARLPAPFFQTHPKAPGRRIQSSRVTPTRHYPTASDRACL